MDWSDTIYLQLPSKAAWDSIVSQLGWAEVPDTVAIDVLGVLYKPLVDLDPITGEAKQPAAALPGYYVNLRLMGEDLPAQLSAYTIEPVTPSRVWA